jgi:hypothetical protein
MEETAKEQENLVAWLPNKIERISLFESLFDFHKHVSYLTCDIRNVCIVSVSRHFEWLHVNFMCLYYTGRVNCTLNNSVYNSFISFNFMRDVISLIF